jgi:hypothetical protein
MTPIPSFLYFGIPVFPSAFCHTLEVQSEAAGTDPDLPKSFGLRCFDGPHELVIGRILFY